MAMRRRCVNATKVDVIFVNKGGAFTEEGFFGLYYMFPVQVFKIKLASIFSVILAVRIASC